MAINFDQALGIHPIALHMRTQKAAILSSNLANQETPGYKSRDIKFDHVLDAEKRRLTPAYLRKSVYPRPDEFKPEVNLRTPYKPVIGGNTVSPEVEQKEWARNLSEFNSGSFFVRARLASLTHSINGR